MRSRAPLPLSVLILALLPACPESEPGTEDSDEDGWTTPEDCDDTNPAVHPGADETCNNGLDDDCDGGPGSCRRTGSQPLSTLGELLAGTGEDAESGASLVVPGDLNGDGFDDLAIGAPGAEGGAGAVTLWFGSADGPVLGATILGIEAGDRAGTTLAAPGDVDGDGSPDLLVGAPGAGPLDDSGESASLHARGSVYLLVGPWEDGSLADARSELTGGEAGDCAGASIAAAGDVDGDGRGDFLVGGPCRGSYRAVHEHIQAWMLFDGPGTAWLVLDPPLGSSSLADADARFDGEETWDRLGSALASAGDVDGDGLPDLAIGAPDYFGAKWINPEARARVHVFSGQLRGAHGSDDALASLQGGCCGEAAHDALGQALAWGPAGLLVGAPGLQDFEVDGGAFLLESVQPGATDPWKDGSVLSGPPQQGGSTALGTVLLADLDLDCDGEPDVALGAPAEAVLGPGSGALRLAYGPLAPFTPLADGDLHGPGSSSEAAGSSLAAGDLDGDGCDDLVVGAPRALTEDARSGAAWWIRGQGL